MKWHEIVEVGYGLPEWKRDRHVFFTIIAAWLAVDLSPWMTGILDHQTFKAHGIFAASMAITSVIKNLLVHNDDPDSKSTTVTATEKVTISKE